MTAMKPVLPSPKLTRKLLSLLPHRLSGSIYHRWLRKHQDSFPMMFAGAPLRAFPGVRMHLKTTDVAHGEIAFLGMYEKDLTEKLVRLAGTEGGLLVDVGANYGYFSLLWCAAAPHNRAIAIEASGANAAMLRNNIEQNGFKDRITIFEIAATDQNGPVHFSPGPEQQTGWGGIVAEPSSDSAPVEGRRLDELLGKTRATAVKIDCEGADALVLRGMSRLLEEQAVGHIFFEDNPYRASALHLETEGALALLRRCGYRVEALEGPQTGDAPREYHAQIARAPVIAP